VVRTDALAQSELTFWQINSVLVAAWLPLMPGSSSLIPKTQAMVTAVTDRMPAILVQALQALLILMLRELPSDSSSQAEIQ